MGEHKHTSSGSRSARETVKVFVESATTIDRVTTKLQKDFGRRARELGIRVKRGTKGNLPTKADAVDVLIAAWEHLPEDNRTQMITQMITDYINERYPAEETDNAR